MGNRGVGIVRWYVGINVDCYRVDLSTIKQINVDTTNNQENNKGNQNNKENESGNDKTKIPKIPTPLGGILNP